VLKDTHNLGAIKRNLKEALKYPRIWIWG